jgi:putative ABC transport system permease protein
VYGGAGDGEEVGAGWGGGPGCRKRHRRGGRRLEYLSGPAREGRPDPRRPGHRCRGRDDPGVHRSRPPGRGTRARPGAGPGGNHDQRIWLGGQWFNVAGILNPSPLTPDIDDSALIGYPAAQKYLGYLSIVHGEKKTGTPSTIYIRAATGHEAAVQALLAQTANPEAPYEAAVSQPSDVLTARAAAAGAFNSLFLGLGVVALIVGAVGVANIMIISVLERRSEIGLRRALGATKSQIRTQFLAESILLAVIGGVVGVLAGAATTALYASSKSWAVVIPVEAWSGGIASAVLIGALAGLTPAVRASRMPPTVALRTV